jgi:phage terminase large subunit-like protein
VKEWNFACPDWEARLRERRSLLPDLPLDKAEADRAVAIFSRLRLPDVPGQPALSENGEGWSPDIVRAIFGSVQPDGSRRVQEVFELVPKKNSKTTDGAGIMITALLMNKRPRAEFVLVGPTQEVADTAFQQASGMIDADPDGYLQKRFLIQEHRKTIFDRLNKAKLKIKTFDMKVATGSKPAGILIDEIHLMGSMAAASRVIGQLRGGMIANPEAFLIMITTQSDETPAGVFKSELEYARGVRDGRITQNVRLLPMLYEFSEAMQVDEDKPWADPKNWPMVLPNLGRSITLDRLIAEYQVAKEKGEEEERRWASQHLNVQIGLALHSGGWAGARYWKQAADKSLRSLDDLVERCEVIVVGIDGGGLDDLLGLTAIGREKETNRWLSWSHAWAHNDVLVRRKDIAATLLDFEKDGDLTICADPTQDIIEVAQVVERINDAGLLPEVAGVGVDAAGIAAIVEELSKLELGEQCVVAVQQGYRLNGAIKGAERKLKDGTLLHADQPLMDWCVGNAKIEMKGSAVLITKQAAGSAKIDPLSAKFNAVMLMARNPVARTAPTYEILIV